MKRRVCFTLLEVLVVMTLVLAFGGVVAINVHKAVIEQRYRTEVELVIDTLRLAQDLMLIAGVDIHFIMKEASSDQGIECRLEVDGAVPKKWEGMIARSHRLLTAIRTANFKDQRFPFTEGMLDLRFQSQGTMMSRGILRLSPYYSEKIKGPLVRAICLPGYPHPIISKPETDKPMPCGEESKEFDLLLTQQTQREILEDSEKSKENEKENEKDKEKEQAPRSAP
jgi:hypothetical protein